MRAYRHTATARFYNRVVAFVTKLPVPAGPMALLTVPGRTTGIPRSTPVALAPAGDGWLLVAAYGRVDWVKNLERSGRAEITRRGRRFDVTATPLPVEEASKVLRDSLAARGTMLRRMLSPYFDASVEDPLIVWRSEVAEHPVFMLEAA